MALVMVLCSFAADTVTASKVGKISIVSKRCVGNANISTPPVSSRLILVGQSKASPARVPLIALVGSMLYCKPFCFFFATLKLSRKLS